MLDMILKSIIKYLDLSRGDIFTVWFVNYHFWWMRFSNIMGRKKTIRKEYWLEWIIIVSLDPCTKECELEVQMIIHLNLSQSIFRCFYWHK